MFAASLPFFSALTAASGPGVDLRGCVKPSLASTGQPTETVVEITISAPLVPGPERGCHCVIVLGPSGSYYHITSHSKVGGHC